MEYSLYFTGEFPRLAQPPGRMNAGMHHDGTVFLVIMQQGLRFQPVHQLATIGAVEYLAQIPGYANFLDAMIQREQMQVMIPQHG